jgi:hypothetical protein
MKRCPECGLYSEDDASFCTRCGCMLPDTPEYPAYGTYEPVPVAKRTNRSIAIAVAAIAVTAILLGVAISYIDMADNSGFGDRNRTYRWVVPSMSPAVTFEVSVLIPGDEMKAADASSIDRTGSTSSVSDHAKGVYAVSEYVVVSDTIKTLANALWKEYKEKIVDSASMSYYDDAEHFSDYILSFVQLAADYAYDSDKFDRDEYWQYPVETLYRGYGDCEDTSILASAIYSYLSTVDGPNAYIEGASVLLLPGHAMVGIDTVGSIGLGSFSVMVGTATHYTGETTIDKLSSQYMTGYLNPDYYGSSILGFTGTSSSYV